MHLLALNIESILSRIALVLRCASSIVKTFFIDVDKICTCQVEERVQRAILSGFAVGTFEPWTVKVVLFIKIGAFTDVTVFVRGTSLLVEVTL